MQRKRGFGKEEHWKNVLHVSKKMKMKLCHMAARSGKIMTFLPYKWTRAFFTLYTLMLFAPLSSDGELIIILEDLKIRHVIAVPSKT